MPGIFEDRERGNEAKWAHDEEIRFKVLVRRNKLLGHWAAGELGLMGHEADEYAEAVIKIGFSGKDTDPVFQKLRDDFDAKKGKHFRQSLLSKIEELARIARDEVIK